MRNNKIIFKTLMLKGEPGATIASMERTGHVGTTDIYTITFSDGTTAQIPLENMSAIISVEKTSQTDTQDIYTITCADGSTQTFSVLNHNADFANMEDHLDDQIAEMESDIAEQTARIDYFLATQTGTINGTKRTETTLFESATPSRGTVIEVNKRYLEIEDEIDNYDYIEIYYGAFDKYNLIKINPSDVPEFIVPLAEDPVIWAEDSVPESGGSSNYRAEFEMYKYPAEAKLHFAFSRWRIYTDINYYANDEQSLAQSGIGILKIVGIKYTTAETSKDPELTDVRVGADGVTYASAGAAVRGQITAIKEDLNNEIARAQAEESRIEALFTGDVTDAVNDWLDEHPEATTTVQDGAITKAKLAPAVAKRLGSQTVYNVSNFDILPNTGVDLYTQIFDLLKNHVSETGGIVYFPAGEYRISDCIFIPSNTIFVGEGAATRIIYTGEYSSMGVGLSNGGDNVGIVNMTVDTLETGPIPSGAVVGAIGFATFDYDSLISYHQSPSNMTRRNAKNLFAVDLWTNSNYILQTETGSLEYSISNVLYRNIHAEKSMVSVMGHENGLINNVVIDNVVCSLLRIGKSGSYNHVVRCNNIVAGRINFRGGRVSAVNVEVRPDLEYEETHMAYAMAIQGTVSIENAYIDASNFSTIIAKYAGDAYLANVIGEKSTSRVWINQEASTENYFVNCKLTTNGNEGSVINGYSSNSKIVSVGNLMTMPGRRVTLEEDTDLNDLLTVGHYQANTAICGTLLNLPSDLTPTAIIVDVTDANAYIQQTITTYTGQTMYKRIITATAGSWYKHVGTKVT